MQALTGARLELAALAQLNAPDAHLLEGACFLFFRGLLVLQESHVAKNVNAMCTEWSVMAVDEIRSQDEVERLADDGRDRSARHANLGDVDSSLFDFWHEDNDIDLSSVSSATSSSQTSSSCSSSSSSLSESDSASSSSSSDSERSLHSKIPSSNSGATNESDTDDDSDMSSYSDDGNNSNGTRSNNKKNNNDASHNESDDDRPIRRRHFALLRRSSSSHRGQSEPAHSTQPIVAIT